MSNLEKELINRSEKKLYINEIKKNIRTKDIKIDTTPYRDYYMWFILIIFLIFIIRNC